MYENGGMLFNPLLIAADGTVNCSVDDALDVTTVANAALSDDCPAALEAAGLSQECTNDDHGDEGGSGGVGDGEDACGCTSGSSPLGALLVLAVGFLARRRT